MRRSRRNDGCVQASLGVRCDLASPRQPVEPCVSAPRLQPGDEEYQFCKLFVVEAAIRFAEMNFDLDIEGLWTEQQRKPQ